VPYRSITFIKITKKYTELSGISMNLSRMTMNHKGIALPRRIVARTHVPIRIYIQAPFFCVTPVRFYRKAWRDFFVRLGSVLLGLPSSILPPWHVERGSALFYPNLFLLSDAGVSPSRSLLFVSSSSKCHRVWWVQNFSSPTLAGVIHFVYFLCSWACQT
jgi:hypothetical protein